MTAVPNDKSLGFTRWMRTRSSLSERTSDPLADAGKEPGRRDRRFLRTAADRGPAIGGCAPHCGWFAVVRGRSTPPRRVASESPTAAGAGHRKKRSATTRSREASRLRWQPAERPRWTTAAPDSKWGGGRHHGVEQILPRNGSAALPPLHWSSSSVTAAGGGSDSAARCDGSAGLLARSSSCRTSATTVVAASTIGTLREGERQRARNEARRGQAAAAP